jgi:serine/threonine-protein kinase
LDAVAVRGSEGAQSPFFSPDGRHIGYLGETSIRIVSLSENVPVIVSDTLSGVAGASWGRDGFIYVDGQRQAPLLRVEAKAGAVPKWFTTLDTLTGEDDHLWPEVLPNGRGVLFTIATTGRRAAIPGSSIGIAEIPSGKHRVLIADATHPKYAASGHILYVTPNRTLMAVPFDQNSMKLTGEPSALIEHLRLGETGAADLSISETGTLVYGTGGGTGLQELVWVTRDGKAQAVDPDWQGNFMQPSLSPDGKQLALVIITPRCCEIWTKQLDRGPAVKLTLGGTESIDPAWTPDGRSVSFTATGSARDKTDVLTKRADGSGQAALQFRGNEMAADVSWSSDGKWLIFARSRIATTVEIVGLRPGTDTVPLPLVSTAFVTIAPTLSPDGQWLAYTSNESGRYEIYVVPFPTTGSARWAVSTRGGIMPLWSNRVNELFYVDLAGTLVSVVVKTTPTFSVTRSVPLFSMRGFRVDALSPQFAISPDGSRFLMIRPHSLPAPDQLVIVENWFEELRARTRK